MRGTSSRRLAIAGVVMSLASSVAVGIMTPAMAAPSGTAKVGAVQPAQLAVQLGTSHVEKPANQIHSVVPGDTLSGIAPRYKTTWPSIFDANTSVISNPDLIYVGQRLTIPNGQTVKNPPAPAPAPAPAPVAAAPASGWFDPLPNATPFCNYWQWRGTYNHKGEDIPAGFGTPIHAAAGGTVWTGWNNGAGNYTVISHSDGSATVYMHQSSFAVRSGWVNANQVIGYVGSTGDSEGPHLHFEVHPWGNGNGTTSPSTWMRNHGAPIGC